MSLMDDPAGSVDRDLGVSFADYSALVGAPLIPEAKWPRYALSAGDILAEATFGRSRVAQLDAETAALQLALCRTADALKLADDAVSAEKVGGYSVNYANIPTREMAYEAARATLAGTGLTYAGVNEASVLPGPDGLYGGTSGGDNW